MTTTTPETCCLCACETGKDDDSLYLGDGTGPYCASCYAERAAEARREGEGMTHTFVTIPVSPATYLEIFGILMANNYQHAILDGGVVDGEQIQVIDMHGLALVVSAPPTEAKPPPLRGELINQMLKTP